jgi:hypothetical protein
MILDVVDFPDGIEVDVVKISDLGLVTVQYEYQFKHNVITWSDFYIRLMYKHRACCSTKDWRKRGYNVIRYQFSVNDDLSSDVLSWLDSLQIVNQLAGGS